MNRVYEMINPEISFSLGHYGGKKEGETGMKKGGHGLHGGLILHREIEKCYDANKHRVFWKQMRGRWASNPVLGSCWEGLPGRE